MSESNDDGSVKSRGTKQEASSSAHKSAPKKEGVASSPSDKVIVQKPTEFDVLFGRGKVRPLLLSSVNSPNPLLTCRNLHDFVTAIPRPLRESTFAQHR